MEYVEGNVRETSVGLRAVQECGKKQEQNTAVHCAYNKNIYQTNNMHTLRTKWETLQKNALPHNVKQHITAHINFMQYV